MTRIETFLITRRRELATDAPGGAVRLNRFINHDLSPRTIVYPIDSSSTLSYASPLVSVVLHISARTRGSSVHACHRSKSGEKKGRKREVANRRYRDEIIAHSSPNGRFDDTCLLSGPGDGLVVDDRSIRYPSLARSL